MSSPEAWQTPVDIPEIGALAGDWIVSCPDDPEFPVKIVRDIPRNVLAQFTPHLHRLRAVSGLWPSEPVELPLSGPRLRRLK